MYYNLIYENVLGDIVQFGSDDLKLNKFEGFGDVAADVQLQRAPYQDGSTHIDSVLEERPIYIEFTMRAESFEELAVMRRQLGRVFNPKIKGKLTITYAGEDYEIDCVSEHVPFFPDSGTDAIGNLQIGSIDLLAPNPYWRSTSITEEPAFEPLFEFPFDDLDGLEMGIQRAQRIITNDGDAPAPLQVDFYGPAQSPIIENLRTGEFIRINRSLKENETFRIDTGKGTLFYVDGQGAELNVYHWIDTDSSFFKLALGDNEITCHCAISNNQKDFDIRYHKLYVAI